MSCHFKTDSHDNIIILVGRNTTRCAKLVITMLQKCHAQLHLAGGSAFLWNKALSSLV
jgi:hypothetical protein